MILGHVESIQVGRPRQFTVEGNSAKPWSSAIAKSAVTGPISVGWTNLEGDQQADLKHHGGPDKAVLAYASSHYDAWANELPACPFESGGFGENLTVSGITESDCCIGDVVQIADCRLQVTQPRQPCWKLSRRWGLPRLAVLVQQTGRTGWYFRVLHTGSINAGLPIELVERPHPQFTVAWANSVMHAKPRSRADAKQLASCPPLSASWKATLLKRASTGEGPNEANRLFGKSDG